MDTQTSTEGRSLREIRAELAGAVEQVLRSQIRLVSATQSDGKVLTCEHAESILRLTQAYSTLTFSRKPS